MKIYNTMTLSYKERVRVGTVEVNYFLALYNVSGYTYPTLKQV